MRIRDLIILSSISWIASLSFSATNGEVGATSTGVFTNTFNSQGVRNVRIFGLQDSMVTHLNWGIGNSDQFCVASSSAGDIRLTFLSTQWNASLVAIDAVGTQLAYTMAISSSSTPKATIISPTSNTFQLPSADVLLISSDTISTAACNGTNANVTKTIKASSNSIPQNSVFTDTVTVVATPL